MHRNIVVPHCPPTGIAPSTANAAPDGRHLTFAARGMSSGPWFIATRFGPVDSVGFDPVVPLDKRRGLADTPGRLAATQPEERSVRMIFLMDPLDGVHRHKDTTYAFMIEADRRGHEVYYLPLSGLSLEEGRLWFAVEWVRPTPQGPAPAERLGAVRMPAEDADVLFIRTDPPFDANYLTQTWLLDHAPEGLLVVNNPAGVRTVNEKIWALRFGDLVPPSLVTRSVREAELFLARHGKVVAKPTDGFGGKGIFVLERGGTNARVAFETLTGDGATYILVQAYVEEATVGDKRILLLDGEPLGALLRVHGDDDHRNNFFAGGRPETADITGRDLEIVKTLQPHLRALGLFFVGIDVIGEWLIEVNVTSPTCLQEMNRLYDVQLERKVLDAIEARVEEQRGAPSAMTDNAGG
jgi:glutathione synthase